jgi:hypothetical protein
MFLQITSAQVKVLVYILNHAKMPTEAVVISNTTTATL